MRRINNNSEKFNWKVEEIGIESNKGFQVILGNFIVLSCFYCAVFTASRKELACFVVVHAHYLVVFLGDSLHFSTWRIYLFFSKERVLFSLG